MNDGVVVIGGGVIGCSIAWYLVQKGVRVTLLERDRIGAHASGAAAGMLGAQVEMEHPGPMVDLCLASRNLFPHLQEQLRTETGIDIEWNQAGLLRIAGTEQEAEKLRARERWQRRLGEKAEWLTATQAKQLEPQLSEKVTGALYLPQDGQVSAPRLTQAFARGALLGGVRIVEGVEVRGCRVERGRIISLDTTAGIYRPEGVVAAAGAWNGSLLEMVGDHLPVIPVKGESLALRPRKPLFKRTLFNSNCYLVPKADGQVIVGATEKREFNPGVTLGAIRALTEAARDWVPELEDAEWLRAWSGLRPGTPDGLPYLGATETTANLYVAGGHFRNGILLSAITGKLLADLIVGEQTPLLEPFSPSRVTVGV
ncbi:glycine oxidase [Marininema mesophilum]|uniref:glycine oxidase n=1 Tax=Marininema mesophilum TaxID=1048340 RepID=A0A1H2R055_9BACL|nr:glycine oxidase ThiO [Marininema mesophilum]SDW12787.1 glycine oxidase [Marininema mesophilum]